MSGADVLYFANPNSPAARAEMAAGRLGWMDTPRQANKRPDQIVWCADNGCYGKGFQEAHWWTWLERHSDASATCVFATAPDVVGDSDATLERSAPWLPRIRALGYPAAFVAQDGITDAPWDDFDCLFVGGTTDWKLSEPVRNLISNAKNRGKWVHFGRVNSGKRWRYAEHIGCDSVDGTFLVFAPDQNLPKLMSWVNQPSLWGAP